MQLRKNQISRIRAKNLKLLTNFISSSTKILDEYVENNTNYKYNINANFDNLYFDIYMWTTNNNK